MQTPSEKLLAKHKRAVRKLTGIARSEKVYAIIKAALTDLTFFRSAPHHSAILLAAYELALSEGYAAAWDGMWVAAEVAGKFKAKRTHVMVSASIKNK